MLFHVMANILEFWTVGWVLPWYVRSVRWTTHHHTPFLTCFPFNRLFQLILNLHGNQLEESYWCSCVCIHWVVKSSGDRECSLSVDFYQVSFPLFALTCLSISIPPKAENTSYRQGGWCMVLVVDGEVNKSTWYWMTVAPGIAQPAVLY